MSHSHLHQKVIWIWHRRMRLFLRKGPRFWPGPQWIDMFGIPAQYLTVWLLVLNWCRKNLFETSIAEITCSSVADKNVAIISAWIGNDRLIEHHMRQQHTIHMCFTLSYHYPCTTWNLHVLPCYLGFHFAFFRLGFRAQALRNIFRGIISDPSWELDSKTAMENDSLWICTQFFHILWCFYLLYPI